jgi:hypothetical protein
MGHVAKCQKLIKRGKIKMPKYDEGTLDALNDIVEIHRLLKKKGLKMNTCKHIKKGKKK